MWPHTVSCNSSNPGGLLCKCGCALNQKWYELYNALFQPYWSGISGPVCLVEGETISLIHLFSAKTALYVKTSQQRLSTQPRHTCSILIRHIAPVDSSSSTPFCSLHPKHTRTRTHTITDDTLNDSSVGVKCGFHEQNWPLILIFTGSLPSLVVNFSLNSIFLPLSSSLLHTVS